MNETLCINLLVSLLPILPSMKNGKSFSITDRAGHTFILNNMVPVFVHGIDNILEQVTGIFERVIYPSQSFLQAIDIQLALALRIQTLPERLYPRIPRVLRLWEPPIHLQ